MLSSARAVVLLATTVLTLCNSDVVVLSERLTEVQSLVPVVPGLSYSFYSHSCPSAEFIVASHVKDFLRREKSEVAGLLRIFFHDCFVQGCDASVLLEGVDEPSELEAIPNLTLRPKSMKVIEEIKASLERSCPGIVSCADIIVLATRDAVKEAGGPWIPLPTGRKDSQTFASVEETLKNLPAPFFNVSELIESFTGKGLDVRDLVALSGAHTVGDAHCGTFSDRLRPVVDPDMDPAFAESLAGTCPENDTESVAPLDSATPNTFDNMFYRNLIRRKGVLSSDQRLFTDSRTSDLVEAFSCNPGHFFWQFAASFVKLSQVQVLTGTQGEVRAVCSAVNPARAFV